MGGVRQISGISFFEKDCRWIAQISDHLSLVLNISGPDKCILMDAKDGSEFPFKTVFAAMSFAKRRRHGRSIEEHKRAEFLQEIKEKMDWDIKMVGEKLGVSPRTVEAWFSGARPVPMMVGLVFGDRMSLKIE